jgi:hypothetical protein
MNSAKNRNDHKPFFLVTIDTEEDNAWSKSNNVSTKNAEFLPRFQSLCESYRLKPSYLVNYEMACSPVFKRVGTDLVRRNLGEIGMHLHAWNSPPLIAICRNDSKYQPYLIEYPENIIREKVKVMTDLLEDTFGVKMLSHRAGRWAFDQTYARILVEKGYRVDCSVTPHVSWKKVIGHPEKDGGSDFSKFPEEAYYLDYEDISRPGNSPLLEVPMTVVLQKRSVKSLFTQKLPLGAIAKKDLTRLFSKISWLRPNGRNRKEMVDIVKQAVQQDQDYIQFMMHSSELMPGGSPVFKDEESIESLYEDLQILFECVESTCTGATLGEFSEWFSKNRERTNE